MKSQEEILAEQLYDRAAQELKNYLEVMKTEPPEKIIDRAYEIAIKQNMVMLLETHDFTLPQLKVLTGIERPLQVIYESRLVQEDSMISELGAVFESYADHMLKAQSVRLYADPKTPRYEGLFREAREKHEEHLFRASRARDEACITSFSEGISEANEKRAVRQFVQDWTAQYGHERCKFVLGYTVQQAKWDERYSAVSKREAAKMDYCITPEHDLYAAYHTNAHPCLVNGAFELLIEQERMKQKPALRHDQPER